MKATVVMRAHNDMPLLKTTLNALVNQSMEIHLVAFDNASQDGSLELLEQTASRVVHVPAGAYVPGKVLNEGMRRSDSDVVVFLNADCEPVDQFCLESLIAPFSDPVVGATFGRQMPRPDCSPLATRDLDDTYGDGVRQAAWRHCFSMACSAVRRCVWNEVPFDEKLKYSEDIAWSWQIRQKGLQIRYVPEARVYHSHNYTNQQWRKRQYGEGRAEAAIFDWSPWQRSFLRYSLLPFVRQLKDDLAYCIRTSQWHGIMASPGYRTAQMLGRRAGFLDGLRGGA